MEFYELTYIIEEKAQERLSALGERYKKINGWNEREMLQFAVAATYQADIDMKLKFLEQRLWMSRITLWKRIADRLRVKDTIFRKRRNVCQSKSYELTYIMEDSQKKRLSELSERFKKINGWNEKEMLQFAVAATQQVDIGMKLNFLEEIIEDWEEGGRVTGWG